MKAIFRKYFEISIFSVGLILMALMDPSTTGASFCLFDQLGISFCPGDGLGHSVAYVFRGQFTNAMEANLLGPLAVVVLSGRIIQLLRINQQQKFTNI